MGISSEHLKQLWQDPEHRARRLASSKRSWTAERKTSQSATMKAKWAVDSDYRGRCVSAFREARPKETEVRRKAAQRLSRDPEYRALILASWTPERRAKRSLSQKALWRDPEYRRGLEQTHREYAASDEVREQLSLRGRKGHNACKEILYSCGGREVLMRSTFELKFAQWCNKQELPWEYEPGYFYVGSSPLWQGRYYCPDFYLPTLSLYVEIKGLMYWGQAEKYAEFRKRYPKLRWKIIHGNTANRFSEVMEG